MSCNIRALNYTQRIIQGDSFDKSYTGSVEEEGSPLDLSNKTIRGAISNGADVVNFTTSTFDSGEGVVDSFRLKLTSSQTTAMAHGTWRYDVDSVDNTNNESVETLLKGNFIIQEEVTINN